MPSMTYKKIVLKKGRDIPVRNYHHWIFSGAVEHFPEFDNGEILAVHDHEGGLLGHAYFNKKTDISGRMLNFDSTPPVGSLKANVLNAIRLRESLGL